MIKFRRQQRWFLEYTGNIEKPPVRMIKQREDRNKWYKEFKMGHYYRYTRRKKIIGILWIIIWR